MFRQGFGTVGRILPRRLCSQVAAAGSPSSRPAGGRLLHLHPQRNVAATTAADHPFSIFRSCIVITSAAWCCLGLGLCCKSKIEEARAERLARPSRIDWVEAGVVSPIVRKQDGCGCCWAMSVVASVEAAHFLKTSQSIALSVQELIDCSGNHGCNGGTLLTTIWYIWRKGLSSESSYPYIARSNFCCCKSNKTIAARISGFHFVSRTEDALEKAVAKQPVVVVLQSTDDFRNYKGGIIEYKDDFQNFNSGHSVLIVGYDTDPDGVKYWRFKNSWGEGWGEGGFGRIRRHVADKRDVLGIFWKLGLYPVVRV